MGVPVCCACRRAMICDENGVYLHDEERDGVPVRYYSGDRYLCPECGTSVVTGYNGFFETTQTLSSMKFTHGGS